MTTFDAILLGFIQGITEFLPVSSSGHLELGQFFLGLQDLDQYVFFNLVCHLGTLLAILIVFGNEVRSAFTSDKAKSLQVFLGTVPLFFLVPIIKPIKATFDQPQYLGTFFLITALVLYAGIRWSRSSAPEKLKRSRWRDAFTIGLFQAAAIFPGVSRSGSTISAGRLLGWEKSDAISFSFLLAIPAILGGIGYETLQLLRGDSLEGISSVSTLQYVLGFISSFAFGYGALVILIRLAMKEKFMYFVWYCLALGCATTVYFYNPSGA